MEMGGNFCQILELGGGTTIKGRRVVHCSDNSEIQPLPKVLEHLQ